MWYLPHIMQPARAMILTAITNCNKDETSQDKLIIIAGILFILDRIFILISVSLVARFIIIIFCMQIEGKIELGASLYFGWVAASLLLIVGVILCINVGDIELMMGIC